MTQKEKVLEHMRTYGSITQNEAMIRYSVGRLAARIKNLKDEGYDIRSEMVTDKNKAGEKVTFARYRVVE